MLQWFAETTLVASGLAVLAALASRLRPISPTARHVLWLVVLLKMMTPPLVCWPWAAHWGDLDWSRFSPAVAQVTPASCDSDRAIDCPSVPMSAPMTEVTTAAAVDGKMDMDPSPIDIGPAPQEPEPVVAVAVEVAPGAADSNARPAVAAWLPPGLIFTWVTLTVLLAVGQASRIIRFRRRLRAAVPAPEHLVDEAERIGQWLGVRIPEVLVVPDLGTPLLWCLGLPKLLLPAHLVKTLDLERWRGILTHELAHLRRGDHWVSRIELAAGLIWWWNPIYWLTRSRLDAEAELACDAWVVWTLPKQRLAYAEALFDICSTLSMAKAPAPALGAAGSGRFFERRLTMILHDEVPCRLSPFALLVACLLVAFALPSWSAAKPVASPNGEAAVLTAISTVDPATPAAIADDDDDDDADDDDDGDADDDDDDAKKAEADAKKAEAEAKRAEANAKRAAANAKKAAANAKKAKAEVKVKSKADAKGDVDVDLDLDFSKLGKEIESQFGPEFEKKMEELGERIGKEIEGKFGPDFEKKMEALGKEMEGKFGPGSDFEKKMKAFGKEMEGKFGPGSDFEKKMKAFGKEMEGKFGPGSDFEKKMKAFGREMEGKFGPGSDFEKNIKEQAEKFASDVEKKATKEPSSEDAPKASTSTARRERRIALLEAQIRKLAEELKALKSDDNQN